MGQTAKPGGRARRDNRIVVLCAGWAALVSCAGSCRSWTTGFLQSTWHRWTPGQKMVGAHATHKAQPFSGQILQNDPGATAYVQELVSLQWQSPTAECVSAGVQVLNCTRALHRTYGYGGKTLFQRQTMRAAWNHSFSLLDGARVNRIALLGSPGAGKSRSMAGYGLRELLIREDPPDVIVFEARKASRVYTFMKAADSGLWTAKAMTSKKFDPAECQYLQNPNNYYFIDAGVEFPQEIVVDAKTIKACSPDRRHYSDFLKESGTRAYFESFTASELSAIHPYLDYAPDLETMVTRFRRAGGNLRVLMSAEADFQAYCEEQQKDAENFQLCKSALMGVLESGGDELRTRLFTYRSNDSKNREVGFCSEGAFQLVVSYHIPNSPLWKISPVICSQGCSVGQGKRAQYRCLPTFCNEREASGSKPQPALKFSLARCWNVILRAPSISFGRMRSVQMNCSKFCTHLTSTLASTTCSLRTTEFK